jgi:hypothetical protein
MEWKKIRPWKTYTSVASGSTIRRAVDSLIGQNLTSAIGSDAVLIRDAAARRRLHCYISVKNTHPMPLSRAFYTRMKKNNGHISRERHAIDYALAAMEQMELYCQAHPRSPSAVRQPRLFVRGELWIALLGPSVEEGIVGIGSTVTAALRAFDAQYLAGLRPSAEMSDRRTTRSVSSVTV